MSKPKEKRSVAAARGTVADPEREGVVVREDGAASVAESLPMTKRERLTLRIFTVVEVIMVIVPLAMIAYLWLAGGGSIEGLADAMAADPTITVEFIAAMCQPLAAWLLRFVERHYRAGDMGYAAGNLIGIICGELMLQNAVGVLGCALLLWRVWRHASGELGPWAAERKVGGVLADISGAIVLCVFGAICAFATWRISLI